MLLLVLLLHLLLLLPEARGGGEEDGATEGRDLLLQFVEVPALALLVVRRLGLVRKQTLRAVACVACVRAFCVRAFACVRLRVCG